MTSTPCQTIDLQLVTFHVGDMLLAIPIEHVQEINQNLEISPIPHAPQHVRGVINLRGEVATVIDLRRVLELESANITDEGPILVVRTPDESVGLCVESVADTFTIPSDSITAPPKNVSGADSKYFRGVHRTGEGIVVIVDIQQILCEGH